VDTPADLRALVCTFRFVEITIHQLILLFVDTQIVDESSYSKFTNFIHQIAQDITIRRSMIQAGMLQE